MTAIYDDEVLMYAPGGAVSHVMTPPGIYGERAPLCRGLFTVTHGTGSQAEYDEARRRRLCYVCERELTARQEVAHA